MFERATAARTIWTKLLPGEATGSPDGGGHSEGPDPGDGEGPPKHAGPHGAAPIVGAGVERAVGAAAAFRTGLTQMAQLPCLF